MKKYVFLTSNIHNIGGLELYVAGKAKYLESCGYSVYIFFPDRNIGKSQIPYFDKYISGGMIKLALPPFKFKKKSRDAVLQKMADMVGESDEIIVESNNDKSSQWGELLAKKIGAKHICFICNEIFNAAGKYYNGNMDFYNYKYNRDELYCISNGALKKLFDGYRDISEDDKHVFFAAPDEPVQDCEDERVGKIDNSDWHIAYIGRATKNYVKKIVDDVYSFANKHSDKKIQFVLVGNQGNRKQVLKEKFSCLNNVKLLFMGDMIPIPRQLYAKLDVVIAGSGSAIYSACEDVPTILADAGNCLANGVFGYDTKDFLYHSDDKKQMSYDEALENVLIKKMYSNRKAEFDKPKASTFYYNKHMQLLAQSTKDVSYYSEKELCNQPSNFIEVVKSDISFRCPFLVKMKTKISRK